MIAWMEIAISYSFTSSEKSVEKQRETCETKVAKIVREVNMRFRWNRTHIADSPSLLCQCYVQVVEPNVRESCQIHRKAQQVRQ